MGALEPGSVVEGLRIERELGRGAFGTVYLAEDELLGRRVALKIMRAPTEAEDYDRGLLEARAAARIKSAHIVTLHRVLTLPEHAGWLLEMEYIEGGSLEELLEREGTLPAGRATGILRGVVAALAAAHAAGVVHGDIKPGNVLLEPGGDVKLADFGLSWLINDESLASMAARCPVGTPTYMAPEVIMGEANTPASDLWSLGVLLFRMVTGTMPFDTTNFQQLFFSVLNAPVPRLPKSMPEVLQALTAGLLERQPEKRLTSAAALALLRAPDAEQVRALAPTGRLPARPAPWIVGRDAELERLDALLDGLERREGAALVVAGDDGCGKSALVRVLASHAAERGYRFVEATTTALEGVLGPLLRAARHAAPAGLQVPELDAALGRNLLEGRIDERLTGRPQIAWAVERLFAALARERPVVLAIENAHEADPEDQRLLRDLVRQLPGEGLLVALTWRTHDVDASATESRGVAGLHLIASAGNVQVLNLAPLSPQDMHRLLERNSGAQMIEPEVTRRVIDLAEGNPLFAVDLMRHLQASGAIVVDGSSIRSVDGWLSTGLPGRFTDLVERRLAGLDGDQRALLDAAAVDGREFDGEALEAVVGRPLLEVLRELQRLYRERHLVEPAGDAYRFTSPVIQEVIYGELAPALRRAMHRRLAEHLDARGGGVDPARLGMHWEQAGDRERAVVPLMDAAATAAQRQEQRRLIDFCARAGFEPGRIDAESALRWLDTLLRLATALQSIGQVEAMDRLLDNLLSAAGERGDETAALRVRVCRARVHYRTRGIDSVDPEEMERAADRLGTSKDSADARFIIGMLHKTQGRLAEARHWFGAASEGYGAVGNAARQAATVLQLGAVDLRDEQYHVAVDRFREAAGLFAAAGSPVNACIAEVNAGLAALQAGRLDGLESRLEEAVRTLTLRGVGPLPAAHVVLAQVQFAEGRIEDSWSRIESARAFLKEYDEVAARESVHTEEAHVAAVLGDLGRAEAAIVAARAAAETGGHRMGQVTIACIDAQIRCMAGDREGAAAAARRACELATSSEEQGTRSEPVAWLAEAVLYGLPPECIEGFDDALAVAARACARPDEPRGAPPSPRGRRKVSLELACAVWEADAAMRDGDASRAVELAAAAAERAREVGHLWLEVVALGRMQEWSANAEARERRDALLQRAAETLPAPAARTSLLQAWALPA